MREREGERKKRANRQTDRQTDRQLLPTGSAPLLDGALVFPPRLLLLLDEGHEQLARDLDGEARDEGRVGQDDREEDLARLRLRVVHLAREQRRRVSGGRRQRERDKSQTDRQIDVTLNLQSSLNLTRGLVGLVPSLNNGSPPPQRSYHDFAYKT